MTASFMSLVQIASILQSLQFSLIRLSALILASIFHQAMVYAALTRNIIDSLLLMFWFSDIFPSHEMSVLASKFSNVTDVFKV
jgi:hypothetical protein